LTRSLPETPFSFEVLRDIYEGLTSEGPGGEVVPGVAEDWSVSPDGLRYSFRLRPDARWSNGEHVTADDFVARTAASLGPVNGVAGAETARVDLVTAPAITLGGLPASARKVRSEGPTTLIN